MVALLFVLTVVLVVLEISFAYTTNTRPIIQSKMILKVSTTSSSKSTNPWVDELIDIIFRALPEVLTPAKEMNPNKVIVSPPKFITPGTATDFSKKSKYHYDDIVKSFNDKYVKPATAVPRSQHLLPLLDEIHDAGLEAKLDEHLAKVYAGKDANPLAQAPSYIYEALETAMAPMKTELNKEKVVSNPTKFHKPLTLSQLRKVLKNNPEYFKV